MGTKCVIHANKFETDEQERLHVDSKAYNLLELKKIGLNIPDTLIILREGYEYYSKTGEILSHLENEIDVFLQETLKKGYCTFAIRCGDKNVLKSLPQTIIHVGITDEYMNSLPNHIVSENKRLFYQQMAKVDVLLGDANLENNIKEISCLKTPLSQCLYTIGKIYEVFKSLAQNGFIYSDYTIIIQKMVLGNADRYSGYGTAYTRHPYTGKKMDYGQYMLQKQGVVVNEMPNYLWKDISELQIDIPDVYNELKESLKAIEKYYKDIRFVEFVIEKKVLFFTQLSVRNRIYFKEIFEEYQNE